LCWRKDAIHEDKKNKIINQSFTLDQTEHLNDMDIVLLPSLYLHTVPYYLKCDIENFIKLGGGTEYKKEQSKDWRTVLKRELIKSGLDKDYAKNYAYSSMPKDGTLVQDLIDEVLIKNEIVKTSKSKVKEIQLKEETIKRENRKQNLMSALNELGIPWSVTEGYPYKTIIEQFIGGNGLYGLEDIVTLLKKYQVYNNWSTKFDELLSKKETDDKMIIDNE